MTTRRSHRRRWILIASVALAPISSGQAQTLELEYERTLANHCAGLGFAHDTDGQVLPGQAGNGLKNYCEGASRVGDVPADIFRDDWVDPIQLVGPPTGERVTAVPGWRDRVVQRRRPRSSEASADASEADTIVIFGFHPGMNGIGSGYYSATALNFGLVAGIQRWLSEAALVSLAGAIRQNGYAAATSAVWAPSERAFGEVRIHYDRVDQKIERVIEHASASISNTRGTGRSYVEGRPSRTLLGGDMLFGYDFAAPWLSFGPRIGVGYGQYDQSAYAEFSRDSEPELPIAMAFDSTSEDSLVHRVGLNMTLNSTRPRFVPLSLDLTWTHEYLDVQRIVTGHLMEDVRLNPTTFTFMTPERTRDSVSARLGFGIKVASRVTVFASGEIRYDEQVRTANGLVGARGKF